MSSGELLKDTVNLSVDSLKREEYGTDFSEVKTVLCPENVSLEKEGTEYGEVSHFEYFSNTTGCKRGANILLPAGYDKNKKYPVLFFLHGIFGDEFSMINDPNSNIRFLAGNLVKEGSVDDAVVVFPNMFATGNPELKPGFSLEETLPYDNFINDLTDDLIPYVEANYSVMTDRDHRGLIGFSMGGRETLFIGLSRSDLFSCFCAISPAPGLVPGKDRFMEHVGQFREEEVEIKKKDFLPKLVMILCGTKDGVVGTFPKEYHELFDKNGIEHLWYEVPEADHDANAIKSGLFNFLIRWQSK